MTLVVSVNEPKPVYVYASLDGFGNGKQVDFQPSGVGWRSVLMCCGLNSPKVYVWTQDKDGNRLSIWTNDLPYRVFLPSISGG
jgi:hypothetical protein